MEHYRTDYRDELFTDTGGVKANKGDKFLYYARLPEKCQTESRSFSVWMKAIIKNCQGNRVWLEKVQVLEGFRSEAKAKAVEEHKNSLINRFRGNKHLTLSKSEVWFIFPANTKTGVSDYISKNGHEALATALGFPQEERRQIQPEDDPEMQVINRQQIEEGFQAAGVSDHNHTLAMIIVDKAISTHQEKVFTTAGVMYQFDAEIPTKEEVSAVIYALNMFSSVIGWTLKAGVTPDGCQ